MPDRRAKLPGPLLGASPSTAVPRGLPHVYRGRGRGGLRDIFESDHGGSLGGSYRWLISTCLAAAVGAIAIFVVIYGSTDSQDTADAFLPALKQIRDGEIPDAVMPTPKSAEGLKWAAPRSDRLQPTTGALSTRYIIHESIKQKRDGREYIYAKPYVRIVSRLAPVPPKYADVIPPFNPFKLYANNTPLSTGDDLGQEVAERKDVAIRVVELLGGILPGEDGQELDNQEVAELVGHSQDGGGGVGSETPLEGVAAGTSGESPDAGLTEEERALEAATAPNTTNIAKASADSDLELSDLQGREVRVVKARKGDTISKLLTQAGADAWQAKEMTEASKAIFADNQLVEGEEVRITTLPSLTQQDKMEPVGFSVFDDGHDHKVTVSRNSAGEFVAKAQPFDEKEIQQAVLGESDAPQAASLYASLYHAGLAQSVEPETISKIIRIHAYDTDFRRRIRTNDQVELFFDMKDDAATDGPPGELLYTAITAGGEVARFYRFRTPDSMVDFYDAEGNNSKKFLMRRPVRGDDVRLTSGFGVRFHPLLNERRMHTGVDWAASPGTPILAAGNGVIEEAERKGQYGNYIRVRHANGYHSAYGHMMRFADGAEPGVKVKQGQVIGYVGSTGLSSGPHLHFEILVNSRFVDPMSIQVPRERKLEGKELSEFQRERARIEDLMRRAPVMTASK